MLSFYCQVSMAFWVEIGAEVVGADTVGVVVAAVADTETAAGEGCMGEDNTEQGKLSSKCPHSPFSWITV